MDEISVEKTKNYKGHNRRTFYVHSPHGVKNSAQNSENWAVGDDFFRFNHLPGVEQIGDMLLVIRANTHKNGTERYYPWCQLFSSSSKTCYPAVCPSNGSGAGTIPK